MQTVRTILAKLPLSVVERLETKAERFSTATELQLKAGAPPLIVSDKTVTVCEGRALSSREISESFLSLCDYSAYAKKSQLNEGFTTVSGGHRVAVCATAAENGLRDVSALIIRIARCKNGCAVSLVKAVDKVFEKSLLVCGAVGSGKTTMLRDYVRIAASPPNLRRVAVVDERAEIAAMSGGLSAFDLGLTSEVLSLFDKKRGFETAIRGLSPDIIVCDELYGDDDAECCEDAARCGIKLVASTHADSAEAFINSKLGKRLVEKRLFDYCVFLNPLSAASRINKFLRTDEL